MSDRIIMEYSEDKLLTAEILAKALEKDGIKIIKVRRQGKGLLLFKVNDVPFYEDEYPCLVARLSQKRRK